MASTYCMRHASTFYWVCVCIGRTIPLPRITFPHCWNKIGNGKNRPWTFVDCSQVMQHVAFISFYINLAFERWAKDDWILDSHACEWLLSSLYGSWRCSEVLVWKIQHMSSMPKAVWVSAFIFKIIQVISIRNQTCCETSFLLLHVGLWRSSQIIQYSALYSMIELFRKRKWVRLPLPATNECHCPVGVSKPP